jgi:N-acetyl-anhydromuramyl-L-alanine amidase AmpD
MSETEFKDIDSDHEHKVIELPEDFAPVIVTCKGVRYKEHGKFKTANGMADMGVMHYTVGPANAKSARAVVAYLASKGLGCPVMDEDGIIYIPEDFDILKDMVYHAGESKWGDRTGISQYAVGLEICCWGRGSKVGPFRTIDKKHENQQAGTYQQYTHAQEISSLNFWVWCKKKNPAFDLNKVVGHDEIAPTRKQDPGGSFSWDMPAYRKKLSTWKPQRVVYGVVEKTPTNGPVLTQKESEGYPVLKLKAQGPFVSELQRLLTGRNLPLVVDGVFGPRTELAVKDFQKSAGLTVDGIVGAKTWKELRGK